MIFVTVGDSMPFDRLVKTVDVWARSRQRQDVFAQIGKEGTAPSFIAWTRRLDPAEFQQRINSSRVIVAHAGMGTILSALSCAKPLLVFPRHGDLMETRNDHQIATARRFAKAGQLTAAMTEVELTYHLDHLDNLHSVSQISTFASKPLIEAIQTFVAAAE